MKNKINACDTCFLPSTSCGYCKVNKQDKPKETKMTDAEIYEVIEGFKNGKKLEIKNSIHEWLSFPTTLSALIYKISRGEEIRVKSTPKYRPFETVEEVLAIRDKWVCDKDQSIYWRITAIKDNGILSIGIDNGEATTISCGDAFDIYTFQDGTPFGVEVKE